MFYINEIENELRSRQLSYGFQSHRINCDDVKDFIENLRLRELYPHDCGEYGKQRGCPFLHVVDGVWKICHRHCEMPMQVSRQSTSYYV